MPIRSLLFVPGDSERKLAKADATAADVLILDLEDSVSAAQAEVARTLVRSYLMDRPREQRRKQLWVRCKPLQDPAVGLIKAVATLTEAPRSLLEARTFTEATPRLAGMSWGPIDLMAALGATTNRNPDGSFETVYAWARGLTIVTARAAGVQPIDTISADYRNLEQLRRECVLARTAGFTARLAIHPDQVPVINEAFTPSAEEVAHARRVVDAFAASTAGAVGLDG